MPTRAVVRGNGPREGFPDYIVKWLRRDKIGVFSGLVHRHFKVGAVNQRINPAWLLPVNAPTPWGLPCVDANAEISDAMCIVAYRYEGADNAPDTDTEVLYELDTSMAEKRIETHPSFPDLKVDYGWDDAERRFSETLPEDTSDGPYSTALSGGSRKQGGKNPLFGIESFFSVSAVFRKSYAVPEGAVPSSILRGIGTIVAAPSGIGQFRLPSGRRNWLKMAPKITKRGNLVQITLEWALSHPGGWKKAIYAAGQLEEDAGD